MERPKKGTKEVEPGAAANSFVSKSGLIASGYRKPPEFYRDAAGRMIRPYSFKESLWSI